MTALTENRRPELIAAFLDEVVEDPRKIPLQYDEKHISWILQRDVQEGRYEYKYIDDGKWMINTNEPVTPVNKDGHINNYVQHMLQRYRLRALIAHDGDGNFHTTIFFDQAEEGQYFTNIDVQYRRMFSEEVVCRAFRTDGLVGLVMSKVVVGCGCVSDWILI
ncbi:Dual specificity phosphatase, catalytic domain-containing protein [Artemisia annua]|uniref:Dual specificity phosphatase, catalytic domain-containing protein n=1 Tax=Artemisia annua TaxID=35608 RepID=A0A2U1NSM5_ARTAN|nr:Dual specificity phosphatase, catalytic domain-containing protein [Artemisia annua]